MGEATAVLVAGRDPDVIGVMRMALEDDLAGTAYRVVAALGLDAAATALAGERVALVLVDSLHHPAADGAAGRWAHVDRLRALAGPAPVILSTAWGVSVYADYAAHGVAAVLPRPFEIADLCALSRAHLGLLAPPGAGATHRPGTGAHASIRAPSSP
ncbi:MAG TPA: hypothetical protein VFW96_24445 [Thermomicrobiales bacterium]|nr:hypothetical protein [Thermomicrobiales bacterium]